MTQSERLDAEELYKAYKRRRRKREIQYAKQGYNVDPATLMEIDELKQKEAELERIWGFGTQQNQIPSTHQTYTRRLINNIPKYSWLNLAFYIGVFVAASCMFSLFTQKPNTNPFSDRPTIIVTPTPLPYPTRVPIPTRIRIPTPTPPVTPQQWDQDGFILKFEGLTYYPDQMIIGWSIANNTQRDIEIPLSYYEGFSAKDNLGNVIEMRTLNCFHNLSPNNDCATMGIRLPAGTYLQFTQQLQFIRDMSNATEIIVNARNLPGTLAVSFHISVQRTT